MLEKQLKRYSYSTNHVGLSDYLSRLTWSPPRRLPERPYDERVFVTDGCGQRSKKDLGKEDALALLAISGIETERRNEVGDDEETLPSTGAPTIDRRAYVIRSLKTEQEVQTLRDVYGPRFFLIGANADEASRTKNLRAQIASSRDGEPEASWTHAPSQLIDRDWKEEETAGQDVRGTFHEADFFINAAEERTIATGVDRTLQVLFGAPYATPTREEYAMFQAAGAARRSAELGRQVGAAIATRSGSVVALGTNEVPAFGGGSYWEGDARDRREYTMSKDTNRARQERIESSLGRLIGDRFDEAVEEGDLETRAGGVTELRGRLIGDLPEKILDTEVGRGDQMVLLAAYDLHQPGRDYESVAELLESSSGASAIFRARSGYSTR